MTDHTATLALSRAVAAHPGVAIAAKTLALELIKAIEAGQREIPPGTDDALARILSRAHEGARVH